MVFEQMPIKSDAAFLVGEISRICGKNPCKKEVQKFVFLIEQKGIQLPFDYELYFYGPYSRGLDYALRFLNADGVVNIDFTNTSHLLSINDEAYKVEPETSFTDNVKSSIKDVIETYKDFSPSELELLTTALFVHECFDDKSPKSVVNGVKSVKGTKYSEPAINNMLKHFEYFGKTFAQ